MFQVDVKFDKQMTAGEVRLEFVKAAHNEWSWIETYLLVGSR